MVAGVHYWEVMVTQDPAGNSNVIFGVLKPGLSLDQSYETVRGYNAWYLDGHTGSLSGQGPHNLHPQGRVNVYDQIGVELDLDEGSLTFYRNGKVFGPGFSGVTGPVARAVAMSDGGTAVKVLDWNRRQTLKGFFHQTLNGSETQP